MRPVRYPLIFVLCCMLAVVPFLTACGADQAEQPRASTSTPTPIGYLGASTTLSFSNPMDEYGGPVPGKTFEQTTCQDLQALPYHQVAGPFEVPLGVVLGFKQASGTLLKRRFYPAADGNTDRPDSQTTAFQSCG